MTLSSKLAKGAVALAFAGAATFGVASSAQAAEGVSHYIGDGYTNNTHGVWCLQESLNYFQAHGNQGDFYGVHIPNVAQDGVWGPQTKQAVLAFQQIEHSRDSSVSVDGVVGPVTGNYLITDGDPYYTSGGANDTAYCFAFLPTTYN
jgi:peptidoglycan hydrolase-like protein with peptidoglycan-binding domain